jgi:DNA-binding MurR/RpiR family transcriptional regulator
VFHPVEKLRGALERGDPAVPQTNPVVAESLQSTLDNLGATASGLDTARLASMAASILEAQTVFTLGFGLSAHLAAMLSLHLQPFCRQVINVVEFGGTEVAAGRLMNIGPSDLLVAISFPRYASDALTLTRYARDRGAQVIVITDSMASPLVSGAHSTLLASASHPVMSSSNAAAMLVIEALVTSLMLSGNDHVRQAEKLTEAISGYLYSEKPADAAMRKRLRKPPAP